MKLKLKLDKQTLQEFFFLHVEKIVLGGVVGVLVLLVMLGYRLEALNETPDALQTKIADATNKVNDPRNWEAMAIAEERKVTLDIPEKVSAGWKPVEPNIYSCPTPINPANIAKNKLRTDPKIYAPLNVRVAAITGPLAIQVDKDARNVRDPLGAGSSTSSNQPTTPNTTVPKDKKKGATQPPGKRPPPGSGAGTEYEIEGMAFGPEGPGAYPMYPMGPSAGGDQRGQSERDEGFVPGGMANTWIAASAIVVQAVVPWEKQFEEYRRCFEKSQDFRIDRDVPFYVMFTVERADVTENPSADPATLKWTVPLGYVASRRELAKWGGFPNEVLNAEYLDRGLTFPAPPFIYRDLTAAMTHPDIPRVDHEEQTTETVAAKEEPMNEEELFSARANDPRLGSRGGSNPEYGPMGISSGRAARPIFTHLPATARTVFDNMTGSSGGEMGSMMMQGSGGQNAANVDKVAESIRKYKLIRFTDSTVKPGKLYRYRVKVAIEDPNHPYVYGSTNRDPAQQTLDEKVKNRLKGLANQETKSRLFYRESDFSPPSDPIGLPATEHYFAATVKPPQGQNIREDRPLVIAKEQEARLVAVKFDAEDKKVDVPGVTTTMVKRGALLYFKPSKVEVRHPISATTQELHDYSFELSSVVADMRGGEPVGNKGKLVTPAEILVFDGDNNFHFLNDTEDADGLEKYVYDKSLLEDADAPVKTKPPKGPPAMYGPGSPEGGMIKGGPGGNSKKQSNQPQFQQPPSGRSRG